MNKAEPGLKVASNFQGVSPSAGRMSVGNVDRRIDFCLDTMPPCCSRKACGKIPCARRRPTYESPVASRGRLQHAVPRTSTVVGAAALNWVNRPYLGQPSRPPNDLVGVLDDLVDGVQPPSRLPDVLIRRRRVLLGRCKRREVSVKCRGRVL